jgi:hypothetical protein
MRMPLEPRVDLPERCKLFEGEIPRAGKRAVEHGTDMAVRKHNAIPLVPMRLMRTMPQNMEIEGGENIRHPECTADMSRSRAHHHAHHIFADEIRCFFEHAEMVFV